MIPASLKSFMTELAEATDERRVEWSEGAASNAYYCNHKTYTLHINYYFDGDSETSTYTFRIINGPKDAAFSVNDNEGDFYFMRNLFSTISVNASNLNNIADDFFS